MTSFAYYFVGALAVIGALALMVLFSLMLVLLFFPKEKCSHE